MSGASTAQPVKQITRTFRTAKKGAGIRDFRFHDLVGVDGDEVDVSHLAADGVNLVFADHDGEAAAFAAFDICQDRPEYTCFPGCCPAWDNSARRPPGKAIIFRGTSPGLFADWLAEKARKLPASSEENLLFINAWNEWAEGNHLEPCLRHRHHWLDATRSALGCRMGVD